MQDVIIRVHTTQGSKMNFAQKYPQLSELLEGLPQDAPHDMQGNFMWLVERAKEFASRPAVGWSIMRDSYYRMVVLGLLSATKPQKWGRFNATHLSNLGYYSRGGTPQMFGLGTTVSEWQFDRARDIAGNLSWLHTFGLQAPTGNGQQIYTDIAEALILALKEELGIESLEQFVAPIREPEPVTYPHTWEGIREQYVLASWIPEEGDSMQGRRVIYDFDTTPWLLLLTRQGRLYRVELSGSSRLLREITPPPNGVEIHLSSNGKFGVYVTTHAADNRGVTTAEITVWDLFSDREFARIDALEMRTSPYSRMSVRNVDCGDLYGQGFILSAACSRSATAMLDIGKLHTWLPGESGRLRLHSGGARDEVILGPTLRREFIHVTPVRNLRSGDTELFIMITGEVIRTVGSRPVKDHWQPGVFDYTTEDGRILVCGWRDDRFERRVSVLGSAGQEWHVGYRRSYFGPGIVAAALHPRVKLAIVISQGGDVDLVGPDGATPLVTRYRALGNSLPPHPNLRVLYVGFTPDGSHLQMAIIWGWTLEILKVPLAALI